MKRRPYSVFARPRPVRTGFLVDEGVFAPGSDRFDALVDAIISHNYRTWGGRTNPIIFFSGESQKAEDWQQLEAVDVDCLKSFSPLPKNLLEQLDERLQPWSIEAIRQVRPDSPSVETYGIGCPPTPENLQSFRGNIFEVPETKFLMFDFAPTCEPLIQKFVHRNFGTYDQWIDHQGNIRRVMWLENLMRKLNVQHVPISDRASLANALTLLSGTAPGPGYQAPLRFIAPCQLPSVHLGEVWPQSDRIYQVLVGDDKDTLAEFWNGAFWKLTWTTPFVHQLWLPPELGRDPVLHKALRNWFRHFTGTGNSNPKSIELLSASLSSAELEALRQSIFVAGAWLPHSSVPQLSILESRKRDAEERILTFRRAGRLTASDDAMRYSGNNQEEIFGLNMPEILDEKTNTNAMWMVDVQIELVSSHWLDSREQTWWMLPRLNSGGVLAAIFRAGARINSQGQFSVCAENQNGPHARRVKPELRLQLPNQLNVVPALITRPQNQCVFTADLRYNQHLQQSVVSEVRISDKGTYLSGLVQVFGNFWTAQEFCNRRFWRHMFARLANDETQNDARVRQSVANFLRKRKGAGDDPDYLAGRVLELSRGRSKPGVALPYSAFKTELDELAKVAAPAEFSYPQGDAIVCHHGITNLTEEEMVRGLNELVELNVLRPGAYVRCSLCGIETWYHVDELKQEVRCPGCGHGESIGVQQEWWYALNTLVEMGVKQGQLYVMHALAALASNSHGSFFYSPSLNLFKTGSNDIWHEVDVPAIAKGEFVLGEVKGGGLGQNDFTELAEIAEALRPQRAFMFLPHENITADVREWTKEIQTRLAPKGIKAQIYALPTF